MVQLSHPYMTTGKTIALTVWILVGKVMSLLFNTLSRFGIAFLPRSKHLFIFIFWRSSFSVYLTEFHGCSLPTVILEPKKIKSVTASNFSPSIWFEMMGPDAMILVFWMLSPFFLELFIALCSSVAACWTPSDLGGSSSGVISFCLFILFMRFSQQEYWSGLPFPYPVRIIFRWCDKIVYWQFVNRFSHLLILCTFQTFNFLNLEENIV